VKDISQAFIKTRSAIVPLTHSAMLHSALFPFVVSMNFLLGLICLLVARRIWLLRRQLTQISGSILAVEQYMYGLLYGAPPKLQRSKLSINHARYRYQGLESKVQQIQKFLALVTLGQTLWKQIGFNSRRQFKKR
jgi:hypothetical protein